MSLILDLKELLSEILLGSFDMLLSLGTCDILLGSFYILNTSFGTRRISHAQMFVPWSAKKGSGWMIWSGKHALYCEVQNSACDLHGSRASSSPKDRALADHF